MHEHDRNDSRAVSPVIGIILMVAVTVILAAVIGAFVLDTGSDQHKTPQAKFEFDYDGSDVTITHSGGETFDTGNSLELNVEPSAGTVTKDFSVGSDVSSGDTAVVTGVSPDDKIRVIWVGPEGDTEQILATWTVP